MAEALAPAQATLGGHKLLKSKPAKWTMREGVFPNIERFDLAPDDARALAAGQGPYSLVLEPPEGEGVQVTNLWVLSVEPGPDPRISTVEVADRRWFWSFKHVGPRHYNMHRGVGTKRLFAADQFVQNYSLAPDVQYWPMSLVGGKRKYGASDVASDVFTAVSLIEKKFHGSTFTAKFDDRLGKTTKNLPIEDVMIDDAGDMAIQRAVGYFPEAGVTVDYDGTVYVYSKIGGDEAQIVAALMPEMRGLGHTDLVDNNKIRPGEIHFLYTRRNELRFDFTEDTSAASSTTPQGDNGEARFCENVAPVPDYQLTLGSTVYVQGTFLTMNQLFNGWGTIPIQGITRQLDHDLVQRAFVPGMDLWEALGIFGDRDASHNANWIGRIGTIQRHYRRTFRINRRWVDRMMDLEARRITTVDPVSGQKGPARAYGDYCIIPSQKYRWRNVLLGKSQDFAINKTAYPTTGILDSTAEPSPATVTIEDADQGIVHVDYEVDPNRNREMILPSKMVLSSMPTGDITQSSRPIAFNAVIQETDPPRLSPSFKLCFVVTASPAVPNTEQQLHRVVIKPAQVLSLVPDQAKPSLTRANGPIMEVRIGSNVECARYQWKDSESGTIEQMFGMGDAIGDDPASQAAFQKKCDALCVNLGDSSLQTGGSLTAIALAHAAAIYASLTDRYEGEMTGYMNGNVHLNGYATEIEHQITPDGAATTKVIMPPQIKQMNMASFLDSNTRQAVFHQVQKD